MTVIVIPNCLKMDYIVNNGFVYDEKRKWYSIDFQDVQYSMPLVMIIKFRRFEADCEELSFRDKFGKWLMSLKPNERLLVERINRVSLH